MQSESPKSEGCAQMAFSFGEEPVPMKIGIGMRSYLIIFGFLLTPFEIPD
jgi:hypothetical protein